MENIYLLDPELGYPFASVSTKAPNITARIILACAQHFNMAVYAIDTTYFENFSTLQVQFENGYSVYIDADTEEPEDSIEQGPF